MSGGVATVVVIQRLPPEFDEHQFDERLGDVAEHGKRRGSSVHGNRDFFHQKRPDVSLNLRDSLEPGE